MAISTPPSSSTFFVTNSPDNNDNDNQEHHTTSFPSSTHSPEMPSTPSTPSTPESWESRASSEMPSSPPSSELPAKRPWLDTSQDVTVTVGKPGKTRLFTVHKCYFIKSSRYFENECSGDDWDRKPKKDRTIKLELVQADAFDSYVHWLYSDHLDVLEENIPSSDAPLTERESFARRRYGPVFYLYLAAYHVLDSKLQGILIDDFRRVYGATGLLPSPTAVYGLFEDDIKEYSAMRRLVIDTFTSHLGEELPEWFENHIVQLPIGFTGPLLAKYARIVQGYSLGRSAPQLAEPDCTHHEHNDTRPRCS